MLCCTEEENWISSASQDIFVICWLNWFPVVSGRKKIPILGSSIVLIKKLAAEKYSLFLKLFHWYYHYICLWLNLSLLEWLLSTTFEIFFCFDQSASKEIHIMLWTAYFLVRLWISFERKKNPTCMINCLYLFCSGEVLNYLDVSQALDTVWHPGFLAMVMELRVEDIVLNW